MKSLSILVFFAFSAASAFADLGTYPIQKNLTGVSRCIREGSGDKARLYFSYRTLNLDLDVGAATWDGWIKEIRIANDRLSKSVDQTNIGFIDMRICEGFRERLLRKFPNLNAENGQIDSRFNR